MFALRTTDEVLFREVESREDFDDLFATGLHQLRIDQIDLVYRDHGGDKNQTGWPVNSVQAIHASESI